MIEFDVETTGLQPYSGKHKAFLYSFYDGINPPVYYERRDGDTSNDAEIQAWFDRGKQEGMRAYNTKFDRAFAEQAEFELPGDGCWHDGLVVAHAVNERRSLALAAVAKELFGDEAVSNQPKVRKWMSEERARRKKIAKDRGEELREPSYADVPMEIMGPYALEDVILTRKVCDVYEPVIEQNPDLKRTVEFEREVHDALYAVEKRGLPAERDGYVHLEHEVSENLEQIEERIHALAAEGGVEDLNPNSSQQILKALKGRGADMSFMETEDGEVKSADAENLRAVDDELAETLLEFRSEYKVMSTYIRPMIHRHFESDTRMWKEPFINPQGYIHANYRQVGTRTGRMSCSDPNMQNQPRDDLRLRYNVRADEEKTLVTVDLSNIEMMLFAAYAGDGRLLEAVRRGEDMNALTAQMLGLRDRKRAGGSVETARQLGKTYNYSRLYGGGLRTIRKQFRCDMNQARIYRNRFDDAYPEVRRLTNRIEARLSDRGYISDQLISGRRFRMDPRDAYKAANYLVQGTAASLLKEAVVKLHKDGVPVVGLVHDEVIAHCDPSDAEEVQHLIEKRLTENENLNEKVPLRAEGAVVERWSDAKPLKDENGKPYLFTPKWAGGERRYL